MFFGKFFGDVRAGPNLTLKVVLFLELVIGIDCGISGDVESLSKRPGRREVGPRRNLTALNVLPKGPCDLCVKVVFTRSVNLQERSDLWIGVLWHELVLYIILNWPFIRS